MKKTEFVAKPSLPSLSRLRNVFAVLAPAVALAGCVLSVAPVLPEDEVFFDERLLGAWERVDGSESAVVRRDPEDDGAYVIEYATDDETSMLTARLGRFAKRTFLEIRPSVQTEEETDAPWPSVALVVPSQVLLSIDFVGSQIRTGAIDPEALQEALEREGSPLLRIEEEDRLILHDSAENVRAAILRHLPEEGVLEQDEGLWRRIDPGAASP